MLENHHASFYFSFVNDHKMLISCHPTEQFLLKTNLERLSFLTRKRSTLMEKEVHAKLGDNVRLQPMMSGLGCWVCILLKDFVFLFPNFSLQRDECIRHALDAQGITATDPKVAVTDNFLCTGGLIPYRDHIACLGTFSLLLVTNKIIIQSSH